MMPSPSRAFAIFPFFTLTALAAGCGAPASTDPAKATVQPIVNGAPDQDDDAVVEIRTYFDNQPGWAVCTGEIVAPRVVLSAAHCVDPAEFTGKTIAGFEVFFGGDVNKQARGQGAAVLRTAIHPHWSGDAAQGYDASVLVLADPASVGPIPLHRELLGWADVGRLPVRLVGYGLRRNNAHGADGVGVKRDTLGIVDRLDPLHLHVGGPGRQCGGDSGGPALFDFGAGEEIVALDSYAEIAAGATDNCPGSFNTRIDTVLDFVDDAVASNP